MNRIIFIALIALSCNIIGRLVSDTYTSGFISGILYMFFSTIFDRYYEYNKKINP